MLGGLHTDGGTLVSGEYFYFSVGADAKGVVMVEETTNVENEYNLFLRSFDLSDEEEKKRAAVIINYIIRQLNNESLRGTLDYYQYRTLVLQAIRGLFKLIYLDFFDTTADEKRMERLVKADVVFASSENFMLMLFTRVFMGKDRELIIKQIEAARPLLVSKQ